MTDEPLSPPAAKKAILAAIERGGKIHYKHHLIEKLEERGLTTVDVVNVLRGGWVEIDGLHDGSWRHRVNTYKLRVVLEIVGPAEIVVITAMRI